MARTLVDPEVFDAAYRAGLKVLEGKLQPSQAAHGLMELFGVGMRTANGYIGCFLSMSRGAVFKTIVSADGIRFMLERFAEAGSAPLLTALQSLQSHIDYLRGVTGAEPGLRRVHAEFVERLCEKAEFDFMSLALDAQVSHSLSEPEARALRLRYARKMPEQRIVLTRVFQRNPDVIAEVLHRAAGRCEGCARDAPFFRPDGRPYLEVHHRLSLADGGQDTVENATALCPNCHRERHYGTIST